MSGAGSSDPDFAARIQQARHELDNDAVNYEATMAVKLRLARAIFDKLGSEATSSSEFQGFVQENKEWLQPYAVFCFLRDLFGTAEHWTWGALVTPTPEVLGLMRWAPARHALAAQHSGVGGPGAGPELGLGTGRGGLVELVAGASWGLAGADVGGVCAWQPKFGAS